MGVSEISYICIGISHHESEDAMERNKIAMIGLSLIVFVTVIGAMRLIDFSRLGRDIESSQGSGTPTAMASGTRDVPWTIEPGSTRFMMTIEPGITPPSLSYTSDQARDTALGILGISAYVSAISKRTTRNQIDALFAASRINLPGVPTATPPPIESDYSAVVWVVALQLQEPYSQNDGLRAMRFPFADNTPSTSALGTAQDNDVLGNYICVVMDEVGNPSKIQVLDWIKSGVTVRQPLPDMASIAALVEVGQSIPPTSSP